MSRSGFAVALAAACIRDGDVPDGEWREADLLAAVMAVPEGDLPADPFDLLGWVRDFLIRSSLTVRADSC